MSGFKIKMGFRVVSLLLILAALQGMYFSVAALIGTLDIMMIVHVPAILLCGYFLYVGYLAWARLSLRSFRHITVCVGILLLGSVVGLFWPHFGSVTFEVITGLLIVAIIWLRVRVVRHFGPILFPATSTDTNGNAA